MSYNTVKSSETHQQQGVGVTGHNRGTLRGRMDVGSMRKYKVNMWDMSSNNRTGTEKIGLLDLQLI